MPLDWWCTWRRQTHACGQICTYKLTMRSRCALETVWLSGESSRLLCSMSDRGLLPSTLYKHCTFLFYMFQQSQTQICMQWTVFCHKKGWTEKRCGVFFGATLIHNCKCWLKLLEKDFQRKKSKDKDTTRLLQAHLDSRSEWLAWNHICDVHLYDHRLLMHPSHSPCAICVLPSWLGQPFVILIQMQSSVHCIFRK